MLSNEALNQLSEAANAEYRTDEIEIDPLQGNEELSIAPSEGVWVRAWVFLSTGILEAHGIDPGFVTRPAPTVGENLIK